MTDLASPRAVRLSTPRWLDARLAVGVLLVLVAVVAGARVFAAADDYTRVYVAAHDLAPGHHVTADDLAVGRVRLTGGLSRYVAAGPALPVGYVVTRFVGAHELLPAAALAGGQAPARTRLVTVPVQAGHLADALVPGDLVDVYLTPKVGAGEPVPAPTLVVAGVPVESRSGGQRGLGGAATTAVVLSVPVAEVVTLVHAVESGSLDLVSVPAAVAAAEPAAQP